MISEVHLHHFGPVREFYAEHLSPLTVVIGENGSGKTTLLKAMYAAVRTTEQFQRGKSIDTASALLSEKLRWTFQTEQLKSLVTKGEKSLSFSMVSNEASFAFSFGNRAQKRIARVSPKVVPSAANSVWIPSREVLSLFSTILRAREVEGSFGFDDTCYDLVRALRLRPTRGENAPYAGPRQALRELLGGQVDRDEASGRWTFVNQDRQNFEISVTAESVRRLAVLERLLGSGYLSKGSTLFFDDIETALHPGTLEGLLDILETLAFEEDMQIFLSTNSDLLVCKLSLMARIREQSILCCSLRGDGSYEVYDLRQGLWEIPIMGDSALLLQDVIVSSMW